MSNGTKTLLAIVVILILIWIGYAIVNSNPDTPPPSPTASTTEPIKIGAIMPLTGEGAVYGEPWRNMTMLALEEVNAAGGVNGRPIEIIIEDDKCGGPAASNAMQKLVNADKVQITLAGLCSSASLAAVPIGAAGGVAMLSPGASSPDLTNISPLFFRNYPSDATQGRVLAELGAEKKWKKVAFLQEQKDYPLGIQKIFTARFEELGGSTVVEVFPPESSDFRSQLTKLRAAKPDALFLSLQTVAPLERILKQLAELKWKPQLLLADSVLGDSEAIMKYKDVLEGSLGAEYGVDPSNPKFARMLEAYKAKFGADLPYLSYAQTEYDAVYIIRDGLLAVGNDGKKFAEWGRQIKDWPGASGLTTIGADGDRVGGHVPKIVKAGKVELLAAPAAVPAATSTPSAQ